MRSLLFIAVVVLSCFNLVASENYRPPVLSTTAIIEVYLDHNFQGIVLVQRSAPPFGKALPGGVVPYGSSVESVIKAKALEYTNLEIFDLQQFKVYSAPTRDPRHHAVEVTHFAKARATPKETRGGNHPIVVTLDNIPYDELVFDHAQILMEYVNWKRGDTAISMLNIE